MVTERRGEYPYRDVRSGGVAARFRPLAGVGDTADAPDGDAVTSDPTGDPSDDAAPPAFATAPWGYRRAEVDSWASWVKALVAHGRNETVRADSAEATLKATLERLEQLQRGPDTATPRPAADLPRRNAPAPAAAPTGTDGDRDRPEMARLQVVERTLHEVMTLLHRLAGPEKP